MLFPVVCNSCGGAGHIASDCKQRRPGESFGNQVDYTRGVLMETRKPDPGISSATR